jgi:hypothetical protein
MMVPFSPHHYQHLLLLVFLMTVILTGVRWSLSVVLICSSFVARDGEHFFLCFFFLPFGLLPLKRLFSSVAHFFIGSLIFREFSFLSYLHILVTSPLSDV